MIKKADILERLNTLIGKELTNQNLHEALFCEEKDIKRLRRFHVGTHTYIQYKIHVDNTTEKSPFVNIRIQGNPNTFRVDFEEKNGRMILQSEAKINYSYF
ncbi:hypothetical protein [Halalkalibacter krulwichiae]|uniref:Uncharacterized protein n=1 Tax=Halalkalibacter krulwichiae TaxID=199441 RepID=A0A1X9M9U3_9BACI|nr:hypothetical protein [Halalkalibacter krulwichiae]ARK30167.1 hypothetical protein BkAM31D_10055 [Halalkalibacter krulwichiae]